MKPGDVATTMIGKSVLIRGELSSGEDLYIDGTIEGTVALTDSRLTIGPNARVLADVIARDVVIHGRLEGNIKATGRVELRQTAQVTGNILTARLSVEEAATITGRIELTGAAPKSDDKAPADVATPVTPEAEPALQFNESKPS